jgi:hypothetical protein
MFDKRYIDTFLAGKPKMYREDLQFYVEEIFKNGEFYNERNSKIIDKLYHPKFGERVIGILKFRHYIQIFGVNTRTFFTTNFEKNKFSEICREYNLSYILGLAAENNHFLLPQSKIL